MNKYLIPSPNLNKFCFWHSFKVLVYIDPKRNITTLLRNYTSLI